MQLQLHSKSHSPNIRYQLKNTVVLSNSGSTPEAQYHAGLTITTRSDYWEF